MRFALAILAVTIACALSEDGAFGISDRRLLLTLYTSPDPLPHFLLAVF